MLFKCKTLNLYCQWLILRYSYGILQFFFFQHIILKISIEMKNLLLSPKGSSS